MYVCVKCLTRFPNCVDLEYHSDKCAITDNNYRHLKLPKERQYLQLGGSGMKDLERLIHGCFTDFECILPEDNNDVRKQQTITASHHPCSFALVVRSDYPELEYFTVYTGKSAEDTMEVFCKLILDVSTKVYQFYNTFHEPMKPLNSLEAEEPCECQRVLSVWREEFSRELWSKRTSAATMTM